MYALEELLELTERQCNTYLLLEETMKMKIEKYIIENINYEDIEIMDCITTIVINLGLKQSFEYIIKNKYKINNAEFIKEIENLEKEYGEHIDNPYWKLESELGKNK